MAGQQTEKQEWHGLIEELNAIKETMRALEQVGAQHQQGLTRIYDVLERIATLEADKRANEKDKERTDRDIQKLFSLHKEVSTDVKDLSSSVSLIAANVGNNTKTGDRWMTALFTVAGSVVTAIVVANIIIQRAPVS